MIYCHEVLDQSNLSELKEEDTWGYGIGYSALEWFGEVTTRTKSSRSLV
jgi:hypothetical protein